MPLASSDNISIPSTTVKEFDVDYNDYSRGMEANTGNDILGDKVWRLAQNARIISEGEYETRKGADFHSDAAGETVDTSVTSVTGAADQSFSTTTWLAQKFTTSASMEHCSKVTVRLKNDVSATGTVVVAIYSDSSNTPSTLISKTTIANGAIDSSYAYESAHYIDAPDLLPSTSYWCVVYIQLGGGGSYKWSSTTSATTAKVSTDSGVSWSATSYALNINVYSATTGGVKGFTRAWKTDGVTKKTLFAHGTVLYSVDDSTGALTSLKTGLNTSATKYRFSPVINDSIYYVNQYDGLRKLSGLNFATESQVSPTNYRLIEIHKNLLFLVDNDDPTKLLWSNFGEPEVFTSTDFAHVPSTKSDPITAIKSINGVLIIWTLYSKYILTGDDNATFRLDKALGDKGTFTQESLDSDGNYAYFMSDDGLYATNGSSDNLLSKRVYKDIQTLNNKQSVVVNVNRGLVRVIYRPSGQGQNSQAYVFSQNFRSEDGLRVESVDTGIYADRAVTSDKDDGKLLIGSSVIGRVCYEGLDTNDYSNMGGLIDFALTGHHMHFGTPSREKEVRFWKPRFETQDEDYGISCEYATDLRTNYTTQELLDVQGAGYVWGGAGTVWGSFTWGTNRETQGDLSIGGNYRRVSVRYSHSASRQPQRFLGHTFIGEMRDYR